MVIGAGGFVGGAVVARLKHQGGNVLAVSRQDVDLLAPHAAESLKTLLRPSDAVVAVAARAPCKDMSMLIDNMIITKTILGAIAAVEVSHVINISSDAVYPDEPVPLTEKTPAAPTTYHGVMHLAREVAFAHEVKAPLAILRPTLLYGVEDPHNGYGPNRFRRQANAGEDIVLFGDGEERRDHVLIDDVAEPCRTRASAPQLRHSQYCDWHSAFVSRHRGKSDRSCHEQSFDQWPSTPGAYAAQWLPPFRYFRGAYSISGF